MKRQVPNAQPRQPNAGPRALAALAGMVLGVALTLAAVLLWYAPRMQDDLSLFGQQLQQARSHLDALQAQRDVLEGQLAVEKSTRQNLELLLKSVQTELGAARDQIAFFNELLPPGPDGSISIRAFDVQPRGPLLHFRVLLMRSGASTEPFVGALQFQASGTMSETGENVSVVLEPARAVDAQDQARLSEDRLPAFALQFDQFQRSTGLLALPVGFQPREITVNVVEEDRVRASRTLEFPMRPPGP